MIASAHAKAILLGEHVVVEGAPALVAGLAAGMEAEARETAPALTVAVTPWEVRFSASDTTTVPGRALAALDAALEAQGLSPEARHRLVQVRAAVPHGVGLGSSAALAVAVVRALAHAGGRDDLASPEKASAIAAASEAVFHGRPSGADAAVAAHGGVGVFRVGQGLSPIVPGARASIVVADTGPRPPTSEMIERVRARRDASPDGARAFDRLGVLSESGAAALGAGDLVALGTAMDEAASHLATLGLETPELASAMRAARAAGALGAKPTGAGGGGCLVALATPGNARAVTEALAARGRFARSFALGGPTETTR